MEILNIYSVCWAPTLAWVVFGIMVVGIGFLFYSNVFTTSKDKVDKILVSIIWFVAFCLFVIYSAMLFSSSKVRYEVKIDETVSFQEVTKDYEVIKQEDDNIWILEKKEN